MELLFKVQEALYIKSEGFVVVGNNPEWTIEDCSKMNVKGKSIIIRTSDGDYTFEVENLNVSISFTGKPNIGIRLKESDDFDKISKGDMIFKL